jgi:predicted transcriptional regulator
MPSLDLVTVKVSTTTRTRVKPLAAALNANDCDVTGAAIRDFADRSRIAQRAAVAREQRARGVRHPRVGRGNKIPA